MKNLFNFIFAKPKNRKIKAERMEITNDKRQENRMVS